MADVRPIRTETDYNRALAEVRELWGARGGTARGDRLDVLATLIDAYEAEHFPMDPPDPIDAIKFRMEQQGLARKDIEPFIGTRTRVAEVLNGKRPLVDRDDPTAARGSGHFRGRLDSADQEGQGRVATRQLQCAHKNGALLDYLVRRGDHSTTYLW